MQQVGKNLKIASANYHFRLDPTEDKASNATGPPSQTSLRYFFRLLLHPVKNPGGGGAWSGGAWSRGVCLGETPPRRLLLRAVRIPLECILVGNKNKTGVTVLQGIFKSGNCASDFFLLCERLRLPTEAKYLGIELFDR